VAEFDKKRSRRIFYERLKEAQGADFLLVGWVGHNAGPEPGIVGFFDLGVFLAIPYNSALRGITCLDMPSPGMFFHRDDPVLDPNLEDFAVRVGHENLGDSRGRIKGANAYVSRESHEDGRDGWIEEIRFFLLAAAESEQK
jgi:hypothetical protein